MSVPSKRPFDSVEAPDRQRFHARGSLEDVEVKIEAQHPNALNGLSREPSDVGTSLRYTSKPGDRLRWLNRRTSTRNLSDVKFEDLLYGSSQSPTAIEESWESSDGVSEENEKELCFGMIHDARVRIFDTPNLSSAHLGKTVPETDLYPFRIFFEEHCYLRPIHSSEGVAVFNEETGQALRNVKDLFSTRFQAYSTAKDWDALLAREPKHDTKTIFRVDIVIYGSEEVRETVGKRLSSARIYLQHPCFQESDTEYDNPHFLRLERVPNLIASSDSFSDGFVPVDLQKQPNVAFSENASTLEQLPRNQVHRKIAGVLDSLTRSKNLKRLVGDIKILTKLLPHQEEALDFMAQREFGPVPKEYSLWVSNGEGSQTCYEHLITGTKVSETPNEIGGGILADDMGLGKTLTVISTVIRTSESALTFCQNERGKDTSSSSSVNSSSRIASRSTLVIVPSALLLEGWIEEIALHCDRSLDTKIYHGRGRELDPVVLADSDIVLSTYHTVATEALETESPLHHITWFRIVLDEAHIIRRTSTKLFRAVANLTGNIRWCLTGTPVQNSLADLAALISFIRVSPLDGLPEFRKHIIAPMHQGGSQGTENLRLLLDSVCLRRTKRLLQLPDVIYLNRTVEFSAAEKHLYDVTQREMISAVKKHDSEARNKKGYFGIFQLQLQLRRLCNHGTWQKPFSETPSGDAQFDPEEALALLRKDGDAKCTYCNVGVSKINAVGRSGCGYFTTCGHLLCSKCLCRYEQALWKEPGSGMRCSICSRVVPENFLMHNDVSSGSFRRPIPAAQYFAENGVSAKVSALLQDIRECESEGKSIVFSCWTRSLDLVSQYLTALEMPFARIDGSISLTQRQQILDDYDNDAIRILLMTTGTGAIGLNLTIANCVYILEPQWNPMVENQAIGRVLRLRQKRDVKVIRYIIKGTVEEGMRSQQTRKLEFAKIGWKEDQMEEQNGVKEDI